MSKQANDRPAAPLPTGDDVAELADAPTAAARTPQLLAQCTSELEHAWNRCRDLFENMPAMSVTTRRGHDGLPIIEDCNGEFNRSMQQGSRQSISWRGVAECLARS
jgi:hypothetical protein